LIIIINLLNEWPYSEVLEFQSNLSGRQKIKMETWSPRTQWISEWVRKAHNYPMGRRVRVGGEEISPLECLPSPRRCELAGPRGLGMHNDDDCLEMLAYDTSEAVGARALLVSRS